MRFGSRFDNPFGPAHQVVEFVRLAEEAGFDAVW